MRIEIRLKDGSRSLVEAWWHPEAETGGIATGGSFVRPAGIWTTKKAVMDHLRLVNEVRKRDGIPLRDLSDEAEVMRGVEGAEAPLEIYDDETDEPWRNTGNMVRSVPWKAG